MALIDLSNYHNTLHQASANTFLDGNVFFDTVAGTIAFGNSTSYPNYTPSADTGAGQSIAAAAGGTFIITGVNFLALGFRPGQNFTASGFVNGGNNATFTISTITTTTTSYDTITVTDNTGMVTEAGGGDEQIIGASTPNSLSVQDGLRFEAIYAFENQERRADEILRQYDRWTSGTFKFGGAYNFVNGRTPAADIDRQIIRGSGWNEYDINGNTIRIYFGNKGLSNINATSQPYYQLGVFATTSNYAKPGQIDEAILVYRDDNGDGTPDVDNTLDPEIVSVRTYGNNYDRKATNFDLGIAELGGYSTGFAVNESSHLTTNAANAHPYASVAPDNTISLASQTIDFTASAVVLNNATPADNDFVALGFHVGSSFTISGSTTAGNDTTYVITAISTTTDANDTATVSVAPVAVEVGTGTQTLVNVQVSPWTGMSIEEVDVAETEIGFFDSGNGTTADFTWHLRNAASGTLAQCVAYLDMAATIDGDINAHGTNVTNGKAVNTWYTYNAAGKVVTRVGAESDYTVATTGLYIENLIGTDKQAVVMTADDQNEYTYPFFVSVQTNVGAAAVADTLSWFHSYFSAGYNTAGAVTVLEKDNNPVKGNVAIPGTGVSLGGSTLTYEFSYADGGGGTPGADNGAYMIVEGDGGVTQAKTYYLITESAVISVTCAPSVENNV